MGSLSVWHWLIIIGIGVLLFKNFAPFFKDLVFMNSPDGKQMSQEKLVSAKNLLFIALYIDIAVTILIAISDLWALNVLNDIRPGVTRIDPSKLSAIESWATFSSVSILTIIGVGLALVRWLSACYEYAKETLKATGFVQEKWTTFGWLIPGINLFKPYKVLTEIYKAGATNYVGGDEWKKLSGSGMLLLWWIFYVITHTIIVALAKQSWKQSWKNDDLMLHNVIGDYSISLANCVISFIVAILWFAVAGSLTRRLLNRSAAVTASVTPTYSPASYVPAVPAPAEQTVANEEIDLARYKQAADEVNSGTRNEALWYKAFAEASGDEQASKAAYIRLRVEQLRRAVIATRAEIATATTRAASTQSNSADMQPARADVLAPEQATAKKGIEKTNFYEALGLLRDADDDQIRDSYQQKKNAIESCPDSESSNKLKFITGAKNVLLNPATRALYDEKIGLRAIQPAMFQACANPNPAITVTPPHISKGFMEGFWERLRGEPWVSWILAIGILAAIAIPAYQDYTARARLADKTVSGAMSQPGDVIDGNPAMSRPGDVMDVQPAPAATFTYEEALAPGSDPLGLYQQPPAQPTLFEVTKKAAEGGNAVAQNKLASFYRDGRIVPKHVKAALYWFEKAASAGQENAQTSLGWAYMSNELELTPDYRLAMEWNRKAANQGFGEGSSNIGLLYESGWGMKVDYVEAANWYQKAIEQHARSGQAELQLGGLYENGFGVEKNIYKATTLYRTVVEKFGNGEFAEEAKARLEAISRDIKKPDGDGNNDWRDKKYGDKKSKRG